MGNAWSPCLKSGLQKCKRDADGLCPGFSARRRKDSGPQESTALSPDGWAPTFLELDLQSVRDTGGFGWVLGLSVEAWGRLVLTKDRKRLEAGCLLRAKQGYASPRTPCSPLPAEICTPLQNWGAAGSAGGLSLPSPWPAPLARGLGNKGLKKSDNFSPQLDLIFFFDAPTAGGRIAGEEQVRQEKCDFGGREAQAAAFGGLSGSGRARSRRLPGLGFILHGPQS